MSDAANNLNWLLERLCETVPAIRQAVVVSSDGLALAKSDDVDRDTADRLAAVSSGMVGLAYGSAGRFGVGPVSNIIVEMERGWLFVTGIRQGRSSAVSPRRRSTWGRSPSRCRSSCNGSVTVSPRTCARSSRCCWLNPNRHDQPLRDRRLAGASSAPTR